MRTGTVIVGVVLILIGAVLMFYPLVPSSSTFQSTYYLSCGSSSAGACLNYTVFDASPALFGGTMAKLSWTSSSAIEFLALTCSGQVTTSDISHDTAAQLNSACGTNQTVSSGGSPSTSGSYTFTIPSSGTLIFAAGSITTPGPSVSVTLTYTEPLAGAALLIIGVIVLIVGAVRKSAKPKPTPSGPPQAWTPGQPTAPGAQPPGAPAPWGPPPQQ
jgi:hypothetical protein